MITSVSNPQIKNPVSYTHLYAMLKRQPGVKVLDIWTTPDAAGKSRKWLNVLAKKTSGVLEKEYE